MNTPHDAVPTPDPAVVTAEPTDTNEAGDPCDVAVAKVDISIAGHTVVVEAHRPMETVAQQALDLIRLTAGYARRIPSGFDVSHPDTQIADQ